MRSVPGVETPGYCQPSRWDCARKTLHRCSKPWKCWEKRKRSTESMRRYKGLPDEPGGAGLWAEGLRHPQERRHGTYLFYLAPRSGSTNLYKIGHTKNLPQRKKTHSTTDPWLFDNASYIYVERHGKCEGYLKKTLLSGRKRGEFFEIKPDELDEIIRRVQEYDAVDLKLWEGVEALKNQESNGAMLQPTEEHRKKYERLVKLREETSKMEQEQLLILCWAGGGGLQYPLPWVNTSGVTPMRLRRLRWCAEQSAPLLHLGRRM